MVRSAAAADSELVTSLISFTPPQMQVAARTHRLVPAASWAPIRASSARVAASISASISPIVIFPILLVALDHHKPREQSIERARFASVICRHKGVAAALK